MGNVRLRALTTSGIAVVIVDRDRGRRERVDASILGSS